MLAALSRRWPPYSPLRGTRIDGGIHASCETQYNLALDWIVCFRSGPWSAPRLARRCADQVPPPAHARAAVSRLHAVVLWDAGGVPEHPAGQCGLLDAVRPPRIDRDGRRPRSIHPSADPARCKRLFRRRREIKTPGSVVRTFLSKCND